MKFNQRIKLLRIEKGLTKKQVAEALGVTANTYARYESGKVSPRAPILVKLCIYYNVRSSYLLFIDDGKIMPNFQFDILC